jgi:hypothetical protein
VEYKIKILVVVGDTHCGSRVGLCPPQFQDKDGSYHTISIMQTFIWQHWEYCWKEIKKLSKRANEKYLVINSDIFEGIHHSEEQLITNDPSEQLDIGIESFGIAVKQYRPDYTFGTRGTSVHNAGEEEFYRYYQNELNVQMNGQSYRFDDIRFDIDGVGFDIAHTGAAGFKFNTREVAAVRFAADLTGEYSRLIKEFPEETFPDIAIRSHVHFKADSADNYPIRVLYCPSWQIMTHWARQKIKSKVIHIGLLVFLCQDGDYEVKKLFKPIKRDKKWRK